MACCFSAVLIVLFTLVLVKLVKIFKKFNKTPTAPKLDDTWWGPGTRTEEDSTITPFKIHVGDEVINDLQHRLKNARPFTPPLEGIQQQYGFNTKLLAEIVEFWTTKYDWGEREIFLNKFPQFTVRVQGLKIHFIHVKPENPEGLKVIPLLLVHGWPGSIREFYEIIPILTTPQPGYKFVFEVIVPSLPGYGFSDPAVRPGLGAAQISVVFKNLMGKLGFEKFYLQGGDWGAIITQNLATLFPDNVLGLHSNMFFVMSLKSNLKLFLYSFWPSYFLEQKFIETNFPLSRKFSFLVAESGYFHLQATKPDTVGVGLNDSPVGLAAYILEKFTSGTNIAFQQLEDGGLTKKFSYTDLLDNVMIYWVTKSMTTAVRLYAETYTKEYRKLDVEGVPTEVPTAVCRFKHELSYLPKGILSEKFKNIVYESDYDDGGHFAAFENPQILGQDIFAGIEKIELFNRYKVNTP